MTNIAQEMQEIRREVTDIFHGIPLEPHEIDYPGIIAAFEVSTLAVIIKTSILHVRNEVPDAVVWDLR